MASGATENENMNRRRRGRQTLDEYSDDEEEVVQQVS